MTAFLTRTPVLWGLFIAQVALLIGFYFVMQTYDFLLIDEMAVPDEISAHIAALSDAQKRAHIWMTATLDAVYPLVYGGFFAGMSWRFLGKWGALLALPGLIVIPVDLFEGVVQVMALGGNESLLWMKAWLTPLKLWLFVAGALIALVALCVAIWRMVRGTKNGLAT